MSVREKERKKERTKERKIIIFQQCTRGAPGPMLRSLHVMSWRDVGNMYVCVRMVAGSLQQFFFFSLLLFLALSLSFSLFIPATTTFDCSRRLLLHSRTFIPLKFLRIILCVCVYIYNTWVHNTLPRNAPKVCIIFLDMCVHTAGWLGCGCWLLLMVILQTVVFCMHICTYIVSLNRIFRYLCGFIACTSILNWVNHYTGKSDMLGSLAIKQTDERVLRAKCNYTWIKTLWYTL